MMTTRNLSSCAALSNKKIESSDSPSSYRLIRVKGVTFIMLMLQFLFLMAFTQSALMAQNPNWVAPSGSAYNYNANVVAVIHFDNLGSNHVNDRIAFFVGNQIRGLSMPIQVGSDVIHFITVYSNQATENMTVKIFHQATNTVYDVAGSFLFTANNVYGNINQPMIFNIYTNNNAPISIDSIAPQMTMQGLPFDTIDLTDYLIQPEPYPVTWTYFPNPNLNVVLSNGQLMVSGNPTYTGVTNLTVRATENAPFPPPQQYAERTIVFNISPSYDEPAWDVIPNKGIVKGNTFQNVDLNQYENQYNGPYLDFSFKPMMIENIPPMASPNWLPPSNYPNTMSITAKAIYTPSHHFHQTGDILAAFIDNELRGVANLHPSTGLFFLSIASNASSGELVTLKLYSTALKKIITYVTQVPFISGSAIGNPGNPMKIDFAPIIPSISGSGIVSYTIADTSFVGEMTFEYNAFDSLYPNFLNAQTTSSLCIVHQLADLDTFYRDLDGDGLGNPAVFTIACSPGNGYVTNDDDCNDNSAIDPSIAISITENSGLASNDGNLCTGGNATLSVTGGINYLWNNGATSNSIAVIPPSTTTYMVTVTLTGGICYNIIPFLLYVETNTVKNNGNIGNGTLRNVLFCSDEGSSINYNLPLIASSILTTPLSINKNITISGTPLIRPIIQFDYNITSSGFLIETLKKLSLNNVDIQMLNASNNAVFGGSGKVEILSMTKVKP